MDRCFFHLFWSFLGKKPPCREARFVSIGRGGAVHVSCIFSDIFCIILSSCVQDVCHWMLVRWSFDSNVLCR